MTWTLGGGQSSWAITDNALMRTLLIDTEYDLDGCTFTRFEDRLSAFDYDVVIWDPAASFYRLKRLNESFQGCPAPNSEDSVLWRKSIARRKREFSELLKLGRSLVIVLSGPLHISLSTGETEQSGTGRNAKTLVYRSTVDILEASPVPLKVVEADGDQIEAVDGKIAPLWKLTQGKWAYRGYFAESQGTPLLKIAGTDKVVGSIVKRPNEGMIILLPDFDLGDEVDGEEAVSDANLVGPMELVTWVHSLQNASEVDRPHWFDEYQFESEIARIGTQSEIEKQIAELEAELGKLKSENAEDERWKWLIAATGEALENQCQRAFEVLGFEVLPAVPGRADIRLRLEGNLYVVEVKGVSKSAAEKNSAQLEKWATIEIENGETSKGILVVNSWRTDPPADRTKATFPDQMISYSTSRGHCLVSGLQLLMMSRLVIDDESKAVEFQKILTETVGRVPMVEDYSEVLTRVVNESGDQMA